MAFLKVKNNAESTLASGINASATSLTVATGEGAKFPTDNFHISIDDEILLCTSRTNDTFTVQRGKEGTTAASHQAGAKVQLRWTAGYVEELQTALAEAQTALAEAQDAIQDLIDRVTALENAPKPFTRGAMVYRTSDYSVANATWTDVPWQAEQYDTNGFWSSSDPIAIVIPSGITKVILKGCVRWDTNSNGGRLVTFGKYNPQSGNYENFIGVTIIDLAQPNSTQNRGYSWVTTAPLSVQAGDKFALRVYQSSGGSLNLTHDSGYRTWFAIEVIC